MLPVKHVLGRLYLAPVTHQPGLRTVVERRRELERARAAAEHDARGPASDESAGDSEPDAGSDSDPDEPAARGPPGRSGRHGPSRGAAA